MFSTKKLMLPICGCVMDFQLSKGIVVSCAMYPYFTFRTGFLNGCWKGIHLFKATRNNNWCPNLDMSEMDWRLNLSGEPQMVQTAIYGIKEADSSVLHSSPDLKNKYTSQQHIQPFSIAKIKLTPFYIAKIKLTPFYIAKIKLTPF